jgi:hypothetical protein
MYARVCVLREMRAKDQVAQESVKMEGQALTARTHFEAGLRRYERVCVCMCVCVC